MRQHKDGLQSSTLPRYAAVVLWIVIVLPGNITHASIDTRSFFEPALIENITFRRILDQHSESLAVVRKITQDEHGFMWIGADSGIYRYDGYELINLGKTGSPDEDILGVYDLYLGDNHRLWIATSGGLIEYDRLTNTFTRHDDSGESGIRLSSVYATSVEKFSDVAIAVGTTEGLNIIDLETRKVETYAHRSDDPASIPHKTIWSLTRDSNKDLWVGTVNGLAKISLPEKTLTRYPQTIGTTATSESHRVSCITEDYDGNLWLCTMSGLTHLNTQSGNVTRYEHDAKDTSSIGASVTWSVIVDRDNLLWVGTDHGGLNLFNREEKNFIRIKNKAEKLSSLNSNTIRTIYEDNAGDLWTGHFPTGINYLDKSQFAVRTLTQETNNENSLSHNSALAIEEDDKGNLWIGTDGGGLTYYDREKHTYTHYRHTNTGQNSISSNAILELHLDSDNQLWIGTWGGGLNRFDLNTGKIHRYPQAPTPHGLPNPRIWAIEEGEKGIIWLGTQEDGLCRLDKSNSTFECYRHDPNNPDSIPHDIVWALHKDSQGKLWVGTNEGLSLYDRARNRFKTYTSREHIPNSLSNNNVFVIKEDSNGNIWIGTRQGLNLYNPEKDNFKNFLISDGLQNQTINIISEDSEKNLWLGTARGIAKLNLNSHSITAFHGKDDWRGESYNKNASIYSSRGEHIFGGINGLRIFFPSNISKNLNEPKVAITDFKIFTDSVKVGGSDGLLRHTINNTSTILLNHKQIMFSLSFSALDYKEPTKNSYMYKLEGFDSEWRNVGSQRTSIYTNLDPGKYTFKVKASNNDGIWSTQEKSLHIIQIPPPWKTWWAYTVYILMLFLGIFCFIRYRTQKIKSEKEYQEKINAKLIRLDKLKSNFLANTSHELLTPLNGIIGISEDLQDNLKTIDNELQLKASMIYTSGKRLAGLVNDILDFSKISNNMISLNLASVPLHAMVEDIKTLFKPMLSTKNLIIKNQTDRTHYVLADKIRLQNILSNLISNAIKYSYRGSVVIRSEVSGTQMEISVSDSGLGIHKEDQKKIFNAFDQLDGNETRINQGAGLGLALTKKLIELHGGDIQVVSEPGKGSTFSFKLPCCTLQNHADQSENKKPAAPIIPEPLTPAPVTMDTLSSQHPNPAPPDLTLKSKKDLNSTSNTNVLIVDDDAINRMVLKAILNTQQYNILEADSGPAALDIIHSSQNIHLVILDVMMPMMSGYEVCKIIRKKHAMHELPIVFLTAKTDSESMEKGMDLGGNDFLTKPTSRSILLPKVASLLRLAKGVNG